MAVLSRGRAGRGRAARPRVAAGPGPPLRRHGPHRGRARRAGHACSTGGRRSSPGCAPPATATSRSTSRASARATSTAESPAGCQAAHGRPIGSGHEAGDDASTTRATSTPTSQRVAGSREGRARPGLGARGVLLRRHQPGRLPRRQDRRDRDRHRDHQRVLPHGDGHRPDRGRLRLRQRRPVHPRPRRVRPAGHRGLPRRAVREPDAAHPRLHRRVPHGVAARAGRLRRPDACRSRCPRARAPGSASR